MRAMITVAALAVAGLFAVPAAQAAHGHPGPPSVVHQVRHGHPGHVRRYAPVPHHHRLYLDRYYNRYFRHSPSVRYHRYHLPRYPGCGPYGLHGPRGFGYHGNRFSLYFGF